MEWELLTRVFLWLKGRDWGLALLLAVPTCFLIAFLPRESSLDKMTW
jgi:hypothetical protein